MSKGDSQLLGTSRSGSPDNREHILATLKKDDTVRRLMSLALVLDDQGHPKYAEEAYEEVIEKRKDAPRQEDQVRLFCQVKIFSIRRQRGLYVKAEDQWRSILENSSAGSTGRSASLSLQIAGEQALALRDQGEFVIAFNKVRDILDKETCSPYQDALHVRLVTILAITLRDCGHYDMSLFLTKNALRASDTLFGNDDPFTINLTSEMSQILTEKGTHWLAEEFAQRALDGFARTFGTDHPQSLKSASRLANAMRFDGRLGDATELFERTLKAQEMQLGSTHPDIVLTKCGLAATYALDARYRDSVSVLFQMLDQQKTVFSRKSHPDIDWTERALEKIQAFQKALSTDIKSEIEMEDESRKMRDFFKRPFRKDFKILQLCDGITLSQKNTEEVGSKSDLPRLAAAHDTSTDFKTILPSGSDKVSVSGICGTTLHAACFKGDLDSVQRLLNSGEDVNAKGGIFETPLCAASYGGHKQIVKLLLEHHADVRNHGKYEISPLQLALSMGHKDLARTLFEVGVDPEVTDHWYGTILHEASMTGQEYMVNLLLEANAELDTVTGIFGTALGAAAWNGNLTIVNSLIEKGAAVAFPVEGKTALDLAASRGHQDIMEVLTRAADSDNETLEPEEKSEPLEQKSLEVDKPLEKDSKPQEQSKSLEQEPMEDTKVKEQSEPVEQKPPKPFRPVKPQEEGLRDHPSTDPSKSSMHYGETVKWPARSRETGNNTMRLAKRVISVIKRHTPSSDALSARFRNPGLIPRKRRPGHSMV